MNPLFIGLGAAALYYLWNKKTKNESGTHPELDDTSKQLGSTKLHPDTEQNSVSDVGRQNASAEKAQVYGHKVT
jgi:hypothetical protein